MCAITSVIIRFEPRVRSLERTVQGCTVYVEIVCLSRPLAPVPCVVSIIKMKMYPHIIGFALVYVREPSCAWHFAIHICIYVCLQIHLCECVTVRVRTKAAKTTTTRNDFPPHMWRKKSDVTEWVACHRSGLRRHHLGGARGPDKQPNEIFFSDRAEITSEGKEIVAFCYCCYSRNMTGYYFIVWRLIFSPFYAHAALRYWNWQVVFVFRERVFRLCTFRTGRLNPVILWKYWIMVSSVVRDGLLEVGVNVCKSLFLLHYFCRQDLLNV